MRHRRIDSQADVDQVVSDDAQADPALHPIRSLVATAVQDMAALEQTDPSFASGTPALGISKPAPFFEQFALRALGAAIRHGDA